MSVSLKANPSEVTEVGGLVNGLGKQKASEERISTAEHSPASSAKPPRATLEQRLMVLDYYHRSKMSQAQIVEKFKDHISISSSTLSEWVKRETEFRARYSELQRKNLANAGIEKRKSRFKYQKMNELMDDFVQKMKVADRPISEPLLREHWRRCATEIGMKDRKRLDSFSNGWLTHFKRRHNLSKHNSPKTNDDSASSKNSSVTNTPNNADNIQLRKETSSSSMCDIFGYVNDPQYLVQGFDEKIDTRQAQFQSRDAPLKPEMKTNAYSGNDILSTLRKSGQSPISSTHINRNDIVNQNLSQSERPAIVKTNTVPSDTNRQQDNFINLISNTQQPVLLSQNDKINGQETTINELEFERFLSRYAFEFLLNNRDKYPSTYLVFENMRETFRRELEMHADERLRRIFMQP